MKADSYWYYGSSQYGGHSQYCFRKYGTGDVMMAFYYGYELAHSGRGSLTSTYPVNNLG